VSVDWSWRFDPGLFLIAIELKPGADPLKTEAALYDQLERVATVGLTERELQKAQNNLSSMMFRELATNNARAHSLGNYEMMLGSWQAGLALPLKYEAVTSEQVKAATAKYLTADRRNVVTLVPTEEGGAVS
jgi:predicted Zn-dependent peptidase